VSTPTEPPQRVPTLRVVMLITPPIASEPYRVDIGPRITSMRSIADIGGMKLLAVLPKLFGATLPDVFWRRPSISRRVYSDGMPRRLTCGAPVLSTPTPTSTP